MKSFAWFVKAEWNVEKQSMMKKESKKNWTEKEYALEHCQSEHHVAVFLSCCDTQRQPTAEGP